MTKQVVDEETGRVIVEALEDATTAWARFRGLMLRRELERGAGLLIAPCSSIHMMFMRFPIDAVFFDRNLQVTRVCRSVPPWYGIAWGGRGAHAVLELPVGGGQGIERGHRLRIA